MTHSNSVALIGHQGRFNRYAFFKKYSILACLLFSYCFGVQLGAQTWSYEVAFDEALGSFPFPSADMILQMGPGTSSTFQYDFLTNTGAGPNNSSIYSSGQDGVPDMNVVATVVDGSSGEWDQIDADWDDTSSGSFRSDYNIQNLSNGCNSPYGAYAYVKFEFTFINGLESSVTADQFSTRHTSTNGASEGYEWTQIFVNGIPAGVEANIANYSATDYNDVSGSTNFDAAGNWLNAPTSNSTGDPIGGIEFPNNMTISEFLGGMPGSGLNASGWYSADGFNTNIYDAPEHSGGMNPKAGNDPDGVSSGDIGGSAGASSNLSGLSGNFGLANSDLITSVTYIFGLTDVAFDTDGDGCTQMNSLPAAGVTEFNLGYTEPPCPMITTQPESQSVCLGDEATFSIEASGDGLSYEWQQSCELRTLGQRANDLQILTDGTIYAAANQDGIAVLPGGSSPWQYLSPTTPAGSQAVFVAADGTIYEGSSNGLSFLSPGATSWTLYNSSSGPSGWFSSFDFVRDVYVATDGTIYASSFAVIYCLTPGATSWAPIFSGADVTKFFVDESTNTMYIATNTNGVVVFDLNTFTNTATHNSTTGASNWIIPSTISSQNFVHSVWADAGTIYAATQFGGLGVLPPGASSWTVYQTGTANPSGFPDNNVHDVTVASDGTIYVATSGGVGSLTPGASSWTVYNSSTPGYGNSNFSGDVAVGADGEIYFTTAFDVGQLPTTTIFSTNSNTFNYTPTSSTENCTYSAIVTNSSGCSVTSNPVSLTINSITAGIINNGPICTGDQIIFTASGSGTYEFFVDANNNDLLDLGESVQGPSNSNTYLSPALNNGDEVHVIVRESNGCFDIASSSITINTSPSIGDASFCIGLKETITGSGTPATSNPYTSANTEVATVDNFGEVTGISEGETTITYTDVNGCQTTSSVIILDDASCILNECPAPSSITGTVTPNQDCNLETTSMIQSGDAIEIILDNCQSYTFKVCYNEAYTPSYTDQVQIQLFNSSFTYISSADSPAGGCATIDYTAGISDNVVLKSYSHHCLADWKKWDLIITKQCCDISPQMPLVIAANQNDCTADAFSIALPTISEGCNAQNVNYTISPTLSNPPAQDSPLDINVSSLEIPAGNEIGLYTISWSVDDCNGNATNASQLFSIEPIIACNDQVNITVPSSGSIIIEPYMVAESIPLDCIDDYRVEIFANGIALGNEIDCSYDGQLIEYTLIYIPNGSQCSGNILIEDKSGPLVICSDIDIPCSEDSSVANLGQPSVSDNCDPNPSLISFDNYIDYECGNTSYLGTIERTWIATDNLGNTNSCIQEINIIRPTLAGLVFPADITINCTDGNTDPTNTGGPSIAAMLSGTSCNFIIYFEDSETPICTGTKKIIRRWYVTDWCTGDEIEETQIIKVEDSAGPIIICPNDLVFGANQNSCDTTVTLPSINASDACGNVVSVTPSWEFGSGNGPYDNVPVGEYNVSYIAEDDCGNTSSCNAMISVIDNVIPVATCDLITTIGIGEDQSSLICAEDIDNGSYDNCELASKGIRLVGDTEYTECITLSCSQVGQVLSVEMQVIDINGLENYCTVQITVFDKIPPTITSCASDITISCDEDANNLSITGSIVVTDNCTANFDFTDVSDLNECNVGEIIRTFTATDNSGNTSTCIQTITTVDIEEPTIIFSDDVTLVCVAANDEIGKPEVEDNCGKFAFSFIDESIEDGDCIQRFSRTWEVLNLCTEEQYAQSMKITLENDVTLPEFTGAPLEITANCNDAIPEFIAPIISDACDNELNIETINTDVSGTCPAIRILTRTYIATDDCGNSNSFTQTINLIDNTGPGFVNFPADQTINCNEQLTEELPDVIDNCDNTPIVTFSNDTIPGDCLNEILVFRTYTAEDACGNTTSATQLFHFVDDEAPIIQGQTNDLTISCEFPIPAFDLGAIDNCDANLTIEVEDTSIPGACPNEEFVTRIYTVIDNCGNQIKDTIEITIIDEKAPRVTASNLVENLTISCDQAFPIIDFIVTDNCDDDVAIIESRDTTGTACDLRVTRNFTATDVCGNATILSQNLTIVDDQAPFFSTFPQDQDVTIFSGESVQVDVIDASIIDNCSDQNDLSFVIDFFNDGDQPEAPNVFVQGNNASGIYPLGSHTVSFSVEDDCGNSLNQNLRISVVDFSPSALCTSVTLEIGENGLLQIDPATILEDPSVLNDGSIASIQFVDPSNFTQVIGDNLLLNCDMLGLNQFAIEIISNDGSSSICSNMIDLIDPDTRCGMRPEETAIAGKIIDLDGIPMKNVEMNLINTETKMNLTDQFGIYSFQDLPMGSACQVQPEYDYYHARDVTTFDMVLIMQHILQTKSLSNPYQHIAADVDMNKKIDLFDLIEIRSLILFQTDRFSVSPSYRFIEKAYQFSNPENPLAENIPDMHYCPSLEENMIDLDFYSIKMGDIDGTKVQSVNSRLEQRNTSVVKLLFEDKLVYANEEVDVKIQVKNIEHLTALQFSLALQDAKIVKVDSQKEMNGNYAKAGNNIHFAWTTYDKDLPAALFNIRIKANQSTMLSNILAIDPAILAANFNQDGLQGSVILEAFENSSTSSELILQQNAPNPFSDVTTIKFHLVQNAIAELLITDLAGKVVYRHQDTYNVGWHNHRFSAEHLTPGIYIYTLTQGQSKQSKKMVVTR